jgi:hypothetical protein
MEMLQTLLEETAKTSLIVEYQIVVLSFPLIVDSE